MTNDQIDVALTPPMGWNSWNCYGATITQEKIKTQADAIVKLGMHKYGYIYVNIDDGWQGDRGGKYNAIQGNSKFSDMQGLCDYIHSLGLKIGIYSTPWTKSYAGYTGSFGHENEDVKQWVEWGIDFLKYDWNMWDPKEPSEEYVKRIYDAIGLTGRKIVLSLSNTAPISNAHNWSKYANMWRTTGDIVDTWDSMSNIGFAQSDWAKFARHGHWNDPDMMVLGFVGWGKNQQLTRLTYDEQITHMTLWCILAAPLILGCDLTKSDGFLLEILTNRELLSVNQDPLGVQGYIVYKDGKIEVWTKPLQNGNRAIGVFNKGESTAEVKISWNEIGIHNNLCVRDIWHYKNLGKISDISTIEVNSHGVRIFVAGRKL